GGKEEATAQHPNTSTPQHVTDEASGEHGTSRELPRPGWRLSLLWIALAACASTLLLATTNHLSQNVAAIPFLWILPLSLYLLSFILCFGGKEWRWGKAFLPLPTLAIAAMAFLLSGELQNAGIR